MQQTCVYVAQHNITWRRRQLPAILHCLNSLSHSNKLAKVLRRRPLPILYPCCERSAAQATWQLKLHTALKHMALQPHMALEHMALKPHMALKHMALKHMALKMVMGFQALKLYMHPGYTWHSGYSLPVPMNLPEYTRKLCTAWSEPCRRMQCHLC